MNGMTLINYQIEAYRAIQPHANDREEILHWVIGLTEEAGEVASLVKHKHFHNEDISDAKIAEELGDVLWYLAAMCTALCISLQDVASLNIAKLTRRFPKGQYTDEGIQHRHDLDATIEEIAEALIK